MQPPVSYIMSGKEGPGVTRYMLEEVYFSKSADEGDRNIPNPQNCYYDDTTGRWYFDFPSMWYNNISGNKAIGLRKIDVFADPLFIRFTISVVYCHKGTGQIDQLTYTYEHKFDRSTTTNEICKDIQDSFEKFWLPGADRLALDLGYNAEKTALEWKFTPNLGEMHTEYSWSIAFASCSEDMEKWLGINMVRSIYRNPTQESDGTLFFSCPDVWNREFLFLHASFVTGTSFNYLGRSGEFYPKPSKMYVAVPASQQFYFQISFNGRTPVRFKHVSFIIDLAYIYYDKNYRGE